MTAIEMPRRHGRRNFLIAIGAIVLFVLWVNGSFDRFFAQMGLDFLIARGCLRTMADTVLCGHDEISRWCAQVGTQAANKVFCANY